MKQSANLAFAPHPPFRAIQGCQASNLQNAAVAKSPGRTALLSVSGLS